jgi:hypothetical protein
MPYMSDEAWLITNALYQKEEFTVRYLEAEQPLLEQTVGRTPSRVSSLAFVLRRWMKQGIFITKHVHCTVIAVNVIYIYT